MSIMEDLDEASEEVDRTRGLVHLAKQKRSANELKGLVKELTGEVEALDRELHVAINTKPCKPLKVSRKKKTKGVVVPLVLWSDWHIEEEVRLEQTNGTNEYDLGIARKRYERLVENAVAMIQREARDSAVPDVVVWLGGDFMSGHIHPELAELTSLSPTEAAFTVHQWLSEALLYIADRTKAKILVPSSYGNHGRISFGKPRVGTGAKHNLEQHVYKLIQRELKDDDRFSIDCSDTAFKYVDLGGYTLRFHHGDAVGYGGGVGGLSIPLNRALARWDAETHADLTIIGHWHQKLDGERWLVNGSLIGTSEYGRRFGYEPPQQVVTMIDMDRKRKAGTHPLFVD